MKQETIIPKKAIKWKSPKVKTITFQALKNMIAMSACSDYVRDTCLGRNIR